MARGAGAARAALDPRRQSEDNAAKTQANGAAMSLVELLTSGRKILFLDGAMGTQLGEMGLEMGGQNCVTNPEAVLAVHEKYAACGIDLLITNTLTMNRVNLGAHKVGVDVREVNLAGAKLARQAARPGQYVLGDISSTGKLLKPYGPLSEEEAAAAFGEQACILEEGGVDGFVVETMTDLREAVCAVRAVREASRLPVMASVSFKTAANEGRTIMGNTARDCARALVDAGACVVGANCGELDPLEMAQVVALMRQVVEVPIIAQANAGKVQMVDMRPTYGMSPDDFAAGLHACVAAGAGLVGGCCGTSPAHIQAAVELLAGDR
jgi:5-methyltetrahydrofolate--homocysteine methyltransferase